jgi:hypothetical protein
MLYDVGRYDLPALAGIDLEETWDYWTPGEFVENPDWVSYTDPDWREIRTGITDVWGLAVLLVHGPAPQRDLDDEVQTKVSEGIANANRWGSTFTPEANSRLGGIRTIDGRHLEKDGGAGSLFAWALPLGSPRTIA